MFAPDGYRLWIEQLDAINHFLFGKTLREEAKPIFATDGSMDFSSMGEENLIPMVLSPAILIEFIVHPDLPFCIATPNCKVVNVSKSFLFPRVFHEAFIDAFVGYSNEDAIKDLELVLGAKYIYDLVCADSGRILTEKEIHAETEILADSQSRHRQKMKRNTEIKPSMLSRLESFSLPNTTLALARRFADCSLVIKEDAFVEEKDVPKFLRKIHAEGCGYWRPRLRPENLQEKKRRGRKDKVSDVKAVLAQNYPYGAQHNTWKQIKRELEKELGFSISNDTLSRARGLRK